MHFTGDQLFTGDCFPAGYIIVIFKFRIIIIF